MHNLRSEKERLREFCVHERERAGYATRAEFAHKKGVSLNTLNWLEIGRYKQIPTEGSIRKVVGRFNLNRTVRKYIIGLAEKILKEVKH